MAIKSLLRAGLIVAATGAAALMGPVAQADVPSPGQGMTATHASVQGQGITAADLAAEGPADTLGPPPGGWDVPSDRSYHLLPSCQPYASAIATGASAWAGLNQTASSGTPVECRDSYITDCGGGGRIVGCNWGAGQRIALYPGGVGDDALLAAHEFGHDWYGHSSYTCASWASPAHVMAPSICTFGVRGGVIRID